MEIVEATPDDRDAMVQLALERLPAVDQDAVAAPFDDPASFDVSVHRLAREGGALLGWAGLVHPTALPDHWRSFRCYVAADHQDRGVARALRASLLPLLQPGQLERAVVYLGEDRSLAVAGHWGLEVLQLSMTSRLDLRHLPPPRPLPEDVSVEESVDLVFPDAEAVEEVLRVSQTNPEASYHLMDLAVLRRFVGHDEAPLGALLRVDGRPAALVHGAGKGDSLHVAYTGVDPALRGRGLALLLKDRLHRMAADAGYTWCRTDNEAGNAGIRHVNEVLGYEVVSGRYWLARQVT